MDEVEPVGVEALRAAYLRDLLGKVLPALPASADDKKRSRPVAAAVRVSNTPPA